MDIISTDFGDAILIQGRSDISLQLSLVTGLAYSSTWMSNSQVAHVANNVSYCRSLSRAAAVPYSLVPLLGPPVWMTAHGIATDL